MALTRSQLADPNCTVTDSDYDAIESAIMETARGRWFLFEYARRHRHADTMMIMSAINSLHDSLQGTLQTSLQTTLQESFGAQKRNASPYQVNTKVSAALLTEPKASPTLQLRVVPQPAPAGAPAPPAADAGTAPPVAAESGPQAPSQAAPLPANTDMFQFK